MFGAFNSVLGAARDRAAEAAAGAYLRRKMQGFGELRQLQIDSRQKTIMLEVMLKGEVSPVQLTILSYEVVRRGDEAYVRLRKIAASREWLGTALNQYLVGQEFKVPAAIASML